MNSIQTFARSTGFVYFLLIPIGPLGILYVPTLVEAGDIQATIVNILANETLFRWSIVAALVTQLLHFILVIMLYKLLKPAHKLAAQIMLLLVMVGVPIAMLNEAAHGAVLIVLDGHNPSSELVSLFLDIHQYGIIIVQIFWGLWLFPFGFAVYKSGFLPKIIGILLMIGCFGYFIDSFVYIVNPAFNFEFSVYLFVGELAITLWLLFKGVNVDKWQQKNIGSQS